MLTPPARVRPRPREDGADQGDGLGRRLIKAFARRANTALAAAIDPHGARFTLDLPG